MIDIREIKKISTNSELIEFAEFVIAEAGSKNFPDYGKIDLMKIARLVSKVFVFDFRNGVGDGVIFHFSGTKVDEHFGTNVQSKRIEDIYIAADYEEMVEGSHHQVYLQKKIGYTHRNVTFTTERGDRFTHVETILFPCSPDDENVDFGLGFVSYGNSDSSVENTYVLL